MPFQQPPIRHAVDSSPDYPFTPVDAPVKLDQNEAPDDLPESLKEAALTQLAGTAWNRYPELHAESLCAAIAEFEDWPTSGVVAATGSNVLIPLLIELSALGGRVVTVTPNFALYGLDARLLGADLTEVPLRPDFSIDVAAVSAALRGLPLLVGQPKGVVFIPQPHAPTGSIATDDDLETIAAESDGWLLVIDEAYWQFAAKDSKDLARRFPNVVLLRTFSKAWGLAGLRLGYALASEQVGRQLRKLVPPFPVSVLQSAVAELALSCPGYMRERVERTVQERARIVSALDAHPAWKVFPSAANFLLIRTPDARQAYESLLTEGVLVRRQDSYYGLRGCVRVTVGTPEENDRFIAAAWKQAREA
jgi:histidinol-phosphate aminotransferase